MIELKENEKENYVETIVKELFPRKYNEISYKEKEILKLNLLVRERSGELAADETSQLEEFVNRHKTEPEKQRRKKVLEIKKGVNGGKISEEEKQAMKDKLGTELKNELKKNQEDIKQLMKEIDGLEVN